MGTSSPSKTFGLSEPVGGPLQLLQGWPWRVQPQKRRALESSAGDEDPPTRFHGRVWLRIPPAKVAVPSGHASKIRSHTVTSGLNTTRGRTGLDFQGSVRLLPSPPRTTRASARTGRRSSRARRCACVWAEMQRLQALVLRRRQLVGMLTSERQRLRMSHASARPSIERVIEFLKARSTTSSATAPPTSARITPPWPRHWAASRHRTGHGLHAAGRTAGAGYAVSAQDRRLGGGGAAELRLRPDARQTSHLGRSCQRAPGALHGHALAIRHSPVFKTF